jgi:FkbM family methyltransferase
MSYFRHTAQFVRHLPELEPAHWLWRLLRKPYQCVLDPSGRGVAVRAGGVARIRVPIEFVGWSWETYEPEAVAAFVNGLRQHPRGMVLDVGNSFGVYSAVALFIGTDIEVVAFDPDLASLAALRRLCHHADRRRLQSIHGFLGQTANRAESVDRAAIVTERELEAIEAPEPTRYICLDPEGRSPHAASIPYRRLDDLFPADGRRSVLLKCDVEGAELHVLLGAERVLPHYRPSLLLSVHPDALTVYGHSKEMVADYLRRLGCEVNCLAVDHEEHWWCECKHF